jgi:glucokinase
MRAVGVDLGGTKVLAAAVHDGRPHHTVKLATPRGSADDVIATVVAAVRQVAEADGHDLDLVGVGAPGPVDLDGIVRDAPNLAGFGGRVDLRGRLVAALGSDVRVRVDNDVNVAALGEARHGAGRDEGDLLAVWWGTGVGGGLVLDGAMRRGAHGLAGEIGHLTVRAEGRRCGCGGVGHLEA